MKFSIQKEEKFTRFSIDEENVNSAMAPALKSEFVTLFHSGSKNLIIDLAKVKTMDSSGLSAILIAHRLCTQANGAFILINCSEIVKKVMSISRLDSVFLILPTMEEAIDAIFMHELESEIRSSTDEEEIL